MARLTHTLRTSDLAAGLFLAAVAVVALWIGALFLWILPLYLLLSLATFLIYAWDKWSAKRGTRRVPEKTLHLLSLFGGWPGALLAQNHLRHKSSKAPFRRVFWVTVALNLAGLAVLVIA
ncbi:MAG: DUF1294 domain-containing protein [Chromatiales bacterium]|nr:DUF1294 domain-containing protein [Chromatiales bacterium]